MKLRIKEIRRKLGMTQDALAEKVGSTKGYISQLENGNRDINSRLLVKLSEALGVSARMLIEDPSIDKELQELIDDIGRMPDQDRQEIFRYADYLMHRREISGKHRH